MTKSILPSFVSRVYLLVIMVSSILAQSNIYHVPYGYDNLYPEREIEVEHFPYERTPRDPVEGDTVLIKFRTDKDLINTYFVEYTVDGIKKTPSKANFNFEDSKGFYWKATISGFKHGEVVEYQIKSYNRNVLIEESSTFNFTCLGWDYVKNVDEVVYSKNAIHLLCESSNPLIEPIISFKLSSNDHIKIKVSVNEFFDSHAEVNIGYDFEEDDEKIIIKYADAYNIIINKNPFTYSIYSSVNDRRIVTQFILDEFSSVGFLNDGKGKVYSIRECFFTPQNESFYGFGERYNAFDQRGNKLDNYVVNIWKEQDKKTYMPVPFYFTNNNYGLFVKSYYYSQFDVNSDGEKKCVITTNFGRRNEGHLEYYLFLAESSKDIIKSYTELTGKPEPIPVWTLGPWISANEWDKQSEIEAQLDSLHKYNIPNGVVVIEAWSDEETFYIFNDAEYKLQDGSYSFRLEDFKFGGRWPDPIGMINNLHNRNMRIVLWNIPVLKYSSVDNKQRDIDEEYAINSDYVVKNPDGTPYRMAPKWFSSSLCLDYTNKFAVAWWMSKRRYLIDELKVDGLRCDGGEFIWGRDLVFSDGSSGDEMRNKYPELYVKSYYDYIKSRNKDGVVFHRAGTFGAQTHPLAWNGDQNSSFPAFREAIRSCINMSISGIPFVAYDIAGYHDETGLTPELYKRSLAQASFSPIMQLHSAYSGDPEPSMERTPWNIAKLLNDKSCIDTYKKFANVRYNIIPYLYSEMKKSSISGLPLMSPLFVEYPEIKFPKDNEFNYLLGNSLLVCPIAEANVTSLDIMLPPGKWFDFWTGEKYEGIIKVEAPDDFLPVFVKEGSIIPLNLNDDYTLSGDISNDLSTFSNLTFYIYPSEEIQYFFYDYTTSEEKMIKVTEDNNSLILDVPEFSSKVSFVIVNDFDSEEIQITNITKVKDKEEFINSEESYFFDSADDKYFIKLKPDNTGKELVLHK